MSLNDEKGAGSCYLPEIDTILYELPLTYKEETRYIADTDHVEGKAIQL